MGGPGIRASNLIPACLLPRVHTCCCVSNLAHSAAQRRANDYVSRVHRLLQHTYVLCPLPGVFSTAALHLRRSPRAGGKPVRDRSMMSGASGTQAARVGIYSRLVYHVQRTRWITGFCVASLGVGRWLTLAWCGCACPAN